MIEVEHLTKFYGPAAAVRDVTFNVDQGEILGFLGPNGAGKTTTMRMITGYLPPTSGTVRVAGYDVAEKSVEARRHIGYLPEMVPLYTDLTTFEYLDFRGRICGLHHGRERKARVYEVMDELNIGDVQNKLIGQLSRGYRQRVGLAQALLHNPDALILDEPTVGLDPVQITEVRSLIKELGRNRTIILSTHLLPEVSMVCDRVVIINRGRLVALDTPLHLAEQGSQAQTVQVELNATPSAVLATLRAMPGVVEATVFSGMGLATPSDGTPAQATAIPKSAEAGLPEGTYTYNVQGQPDTELRPKIAAILVGAGYDLLELKGVRLSLEDIFLRVVAQGAEEEEAEDYEEYGEEPGDESGDGHGEYEEVKKARPVKAAKTAPARTVRVAERRVRK
jgi:gliding motility-associated transport system ATP-binding protein